ncbi:E3 SUMO-protein ligase PIAS2 [Patella vulgata]|uniref:E3 SUMO-protein ligase PIAS2 n=1 Tax=Patella vulgata TaxID=6465 RepID=UPI0024A94E8C|nr:E3 SUMO-protein ligase PIAS2 [Patella vulgata]
MSRDFRPGAKCEYTVQVQLRFFWAGRFCFVLFVCVVVGDFLCFQTARCQKKSVCDRPLTISDLLEFKASKPNNILVSWSSEDGVGYCLAVFLVRRLTSDILLQRLKQFGNRHPDHTRALIKEKLVHDPDSEIATTSLRVSLMCPLGKMRLQIPCRASTCTHLQCYDANTFLMMNEKKSTWICPVCDKAASFDKLIIDGYFLEIFRASPECSEIQFHPDGNWSPLEQPKETHIISSPVVKVTTKPEPSSTSAIEVKNEPDVIDLTLDSSDEEEVEEEVVAPKSVSDKGPQSFDTTACPIIINDSINALDLSPSGSLGISPYPVNFQDITCTLPQFDRMQENYTVPNGRSGMESISPPSNYSTTVTGMFSNQVYPEDLRMIPPLQKSPVQNINPSKAWNLPEPPPLIPIETRSTDYITPTLPNSISLPNFLDDPEFFSIMNNESGQMVMLN